MNYQAFVKLLATHVVVWFMIFMFAISLESCAPNLPEQTVKYPKSR